MEELGTGGNNFQLMAKAPQASPKSSESHLSFSVLFQIESERSFFCFIVWLLHNLQLHILLFSAVSKRICGTDHQQFFLVCLSFHAFIFFNENFGNA